jgi:hypothetical protein
MDLAEGVMGARSIGAFHGRVNEYPMELQRSRAVTQVFTSLDPVGQPPRWIAQEICTHASCRTRDREATARGAAGSDSPTLLPSAPATPPDGSAS